MILKVPGSSEKPEKIAIKNGTDKLKFSAQEIK